MSYLYNSKRLKARRRTLRRKQTPQEVIVWSRLRSHRLNNLKFFRQYSVGPYIVDFYCPSLRLAIEIDGGQHNETIKIESDRLRTDYLIKQNIKVLRFWNNDVNTNIEGVIEMILEIVNPS